MSYEQAYQEGFRKVAQAAGIDPAVLMKCAGFGAIIAKGTKMAPKLTNAAKRFGSLVRGTEKANLAAKAQKATKALDRARKGYNTARKAVGVDPAQLKAMKTNVGRLSRQRTAASKALALEGKKVLGTRAALGAGGTLTAFGLGRASKPGQPQENDAAGGGYPMMGGGYDLSYASPDYLAGFHTPLAHIVAQNYNSWHNGYYGY